MPHVARKKDHALINHQPGTCPARPAACDGPARDGSPDVFVNGEKVLRLTDVGTHRVCCGPNKWQPVQGSANLFVNGIRVVRQGDKTIHCGGYGYMRDG